MSHAPINVAYLLFFLHWKGFAVMSEASTSHWPTYPGRPIQNNLEHNTQQSLRNSSQHPVHHQSHFLPSTSSHHTHVQYGTSQPELQLEYLHEQGGLDGFGVRPFTSTQPQSFTQSTAIGVGQGPGNAEPRYTAVTATAIAADAVPGDAFRFGQQTANPTRHLNTSPNSLLGHQQTFGNNFSFEASLAGGAPEGVPPHDGFRGQTQSPPHHGQTYNGTATYVPHQKRSRMDAGIDVFTVADGSGSGDDEGEYGYSLGESLDPLGHPNMSGQSPEMLAQIHSGPLYGDSGYTGISDQGSRQGNQGQQVGSDGKMKP